MYIDFRHGLTESIIQFDQTVNKDFINNFIYKFSLIEIQNVIYRPHVFVSYNLPKDLQNWQKIIFIKNIYCDIYVQNNNNDYYFYIQIISEINLTYNRIIIMNCLIISNIIKYNILFIHSGLLNNGTLFFGSSFAGKTTLFNRINNNNQIIRAISSEDVIINLDEKCIYSLSNRWKYEKITEEEIDTKLPFNKIYKLKKDEKEIIYEDEKQWKEMLFLCSKKPLCHDPFGQMRTEGMEYNLFSAISKIDTIINKRLYYLINKIIIDNSIKPLILTTNNDDILKKYDIFSDYSKFYIQINLGNNIQFIQCDQTVKDLNLKDFTSQFNIIQKNKIVNPTITISMFLPQNIQSWNKFFIKKYNYILYYKFNNNKLYFYIQILNIEENIIFKNQIKNLILKYILISNILSFNILYINAILLNNGDIILYSSEEQRKNIINTINEKIKIISENGLMLNIDKKELYPLTLFQKNKTLQYKIDLNNYVKLNKIYSFNQKISSNILLESSKLFLDSLKEQKQNNNFNFDVLLKVQKKIEQYVKIINKYKK